VMPFEVDDPPPPHAYIADNRRTVSVLMRLLCRKLLMASSG